MIRLDLDSLSKGYAGRIHTVCRVAEEVVRRCEALQDGAVWIQRVSTEALMERASRLDAEVQSRGQATSLRPLFGVPFAVKDNIDVAGWPTTAACPEMAYTPGRSASVVECLEKAGALFVGKTNMDQFATGLVGTRSPYGACSNVFNPEYISGGSSSGSAVAVASGCVSFSLGTDTAGSGRVPAAFNNIVGLKPTRGLISSRGVVPACRSLDCVSIFALNCGDAWRVLDACSVYDAEDPYSRRPRAGRGAWIHQAGTSGFRFAVPPDDQLKFFGNSAFDSLYKRAINALARVGGECVEMDFGPFWETGRLLYEGPWISERKVSIETFLDGLPGSVLPVTRQVLDRAEGFSAKDAFRGQHLLKRFQREVEVQFETVGCLLLPTAGSIWKKSEIEADPIRLNADLGFYTNFVNLLDLAAVSVPFAFTDVGLPFGVSLIAPAGADSWLLTVGAQLHAASGLRMGHTEWPVPEPGVLMRDSEPPFVDLAVAGLHMKGEKLNHQLTRRGAVPLRTCRTERKYSLYAIRRNGVSVPGLVRNGAGKGASIEVEIWRMPAAELGRFIADVLPPHAIGTIEIEDGSKVKGFLCESVGVEGAEEITSLGGWRAYSKEMIGS